MSEQDDLFGKPPAPEKDPIIEAIERREIGIARAVGRAERTAPGWSDRAFQHLLAYARTVEDFTIEQARLAFAERPASQKAWGGPTQKAIKRGLIVPTGAVRPTNSSNRSKKAVYRAGT